MKPKQIQGLTLLACGLLIGAGLGATNAKTASNLIKNGTFETSVAGWHGQAISNVKHSSKIQHPPNMITRVTNDTAKGSKGALKVTIKGAVKMKAMSHNTGAVGELTTKVAKGASVKVNFDAKSLAGTKWLRVSRTWSGFKGGGPVKLTDKWKHYTVNITVDYPTSSLIFSLVAKNRPQAEMQAVADGSFLLDNITVTKMNNQK